MRLLPLAILTCFLSATLPACAAENANIVPGDQKTFDEGAKAYDEGRYEEAFKIFSKLADNEDLAAMRNVALMERHGLGTEKDPASALKLLKYVARAGLPTAQYDVAVMLLDGETGTPDAKSALPWLELAAQSSHPLAQFRLGQMYEYGNAVPQDYFKAQLLYAAAAEHGVKAALERLSYLKGWPQPNYPDENAALPPPAPEEHPADPQAPVPQEPSAPATTP